MGGIPVAVFKPSAAPTPFYVFADNLGTPRAITNAGGQLTWQWDGEPFGATAANSNPTGLGVFTYNLRFPGQYLDVETGFHHNGWREYDPVLGRYVQSDPIGLAGGLNTYAYAGSNPLSRFDPLGLLCVCAYTQALQANAKDASLGQCAKYVRTALEAGGADTRNRPVAAKDYGDLLKRNGFTEVSSENYTPQPGDTVVFDSYAGGSAYGHIQGYTGAGTSGWTSDFKQPRFWASRGYEKANTYKVYRPSDTGNVVDGSCACK